MAVGVVLVVVVGAALALILTRSPARSPSSVDPDVTIECGAGTGLDPDDCAAWGDGALTAGPPSSTFEMKDLARLELTRSLLGFGPECSAVYYIERYPDDPVWTEPAGCP